MRAKRRKFTAAFKAQVAIEALKERLTLAEISKKFEVHPNLISKWKQEFLARSAEILIPNLRRWILKLNGISFMPGSGG